MSTDPTSGVRLRDMAEDDLPILFDHQRDPAANAVAAFAARDRESLMEHWMTKVIGDGTVTKKIILFDEQVVGASPAVRSPCSWSTWTRAPSTRTSRNATQRPSGSWRSVASSSLGEDTIVDPDDEIEELILRLDRT